MDKVITKKVEEIFEDIEGDEDNILMTIPPEIMELQGWKEGDTLRFETNDHGLTITKVEGDIQGG